MSPESCPLCHGDSEVIDSRKRTTHRWRMRRCLRCLERWETFESRIDPDDLPQKMADRLNA
jgi:transcriptional regulator NrdR family protein